jgi:hypothetical protein
MNNNNVLFDSCFQFFLLPQLRATRAISGHSVPIIASAPAGAGAILRVFGPETMGGIGDFGARIDAEIARTGLSDLEIGFKVHISIHILNLFELKLILFPKIYSRIEGQLVQIPGLPAMYDYEFFPQKV